MNTININALAPWGLTLRIDGIDVVTCAPTVKGLRNLAGLENRLKGVEGIPGDDVIEELRTGLRDFCTAAGHPVIDQAEYETLQTAFIAAAAYYGEWAKKKRNAAQRAALHAAGVPDAEIQLDEELAAARKRVELASLRARLANDGS